MDKIYSDFELSNKTAIVFDNCKNPEKYPFIVNFSQTRVNLEQSSGPTVAREENYKFYA